METHARSILKSITWRFTSSIATFIIVFFFTGQLVLSTAISLMDLVVNLVIYYGHERIWNRIGWGRKIVESN